MHSPLSPSKARLLVLILLIAAGVVAAAQRPARNAAASEAGISADRLSRLDKVFQQYVDENRVAGAVALVLRDGQPVYEKAVGWSDKEAGRRMTVDTIFRIASQTKAITSAAILALVEEGRLGVTDRRSAASFRPSRRRPWRSSGETGVDDGAGAARHHDSRSADAHGGHLVRHRRAGVGAVRGQGARTGGGIRLVHRGQGRAASARRWSGWRRCRSSRSPGEAVRLRLQHRHPRLRRRARVRHAARRVHRDADHDAARHEGHALLPAGRPSATGSRPSTRAGRDGHDRPRAPDGARGQGHYVEGPRKSFSGGAGLVSTARDYARFLEMIRNGGALDGVRILAPRTVAADDDQPERHAALDDRPGLRLRIRDGRSLRRATGWTSVGAFGWGGAYGSTYLVDPETRLVIVFMIQLMPNRTDLGTKFPTLVYQALTDPPRIGTH